MGERECEKVGGESKLRGRGRRGMRETGKKINNGIGTGDKEGECE